ncbi:hypothetical protein LCGC14_2032380, partial [marine sediment metagenome]
MRVNIIGLGSNWKQAPMDGECWGVGMLILKRSVSLLFLMHPQKLIHEYYEEHEEVMEKIRETKTQVITIEEDESLPGALIYPIEKMKSQYFTSTIAYMIAYAIHKGYTEIHLYGVPLVVKPEYHEQKCCIEFWIGMAKGTEIDVTIHGRTTLFGT